MSSPWRMAWRTIFSSPVRSGRPLRTRPIAGGARWARRVSPWGRPWMVSSNLSCHVAMRRGTGRHRRESLLERMEAGMDDGIERKPTRPYISSNRASTARPVPSTGFARRRAFGSVPRSRSIHAGRWTSRVWGRAGRAAGPVAAGDAGTLLPGPFGRIAGALDARGGA